MKAGDSPTCTTSRIVAHFHQMVPQVNHIARDVHFGNRLDQTTLLNQEALDAIREVSRGSIAVSAIKTGHQYSPMNTRNQLLLVLFPPIHRMEADATVGSIFNLLARYVSIKKVFNTPLSKIVLGCVATPSSSK